MAEALARLRALRRDTYRCQHRPYCGARTALVGLVDDVLVTLCATHGGAR